MDDPMGGMHGGMGVTGGVGVSMGSQAGDEVGPAGSIVISTFSWNAHLLTKVRGEGARAL